MVVARNAVPIFGVVVLDWSAALAVFVIWFDGVTSVATMVAGCVHTIVRTDRSMRGWSLASWLLVTGLFTLPYWFLFGALAVSHFGTDFWSALVTSNDALGLLAFVLASNIMESVMRGYHRMTEEEMRRAFNWEIHIHIARAATLLLVGAFFFNVTAFYVVAVIALSYVEIYPLRAIRFFGGDETLT